MIFENEVYMKKHFLFTLITLFLCGLLVFCGCAANPPATGTPQHTFAPEGSAPNATQTMQTTGVPVVVLASPAPQVRYANGKNVRIRAEASTDAAVLDTLYTGEMVTILQQEEVWSKVQYNQITGYVHNTLLSNQKPTPNPQEVTQPRIIVLKSARLLEVWDGEKLFAAYPIGLGFASQGPNQKEGDGKTPEGEYYVCMRNTQSRYYLSLGVSYPNGQDAQRGLQDGLIDQSTHNTITSAIASGERPPWNTALGGEIMIHGHGAATDWTAGCIAVENEVMDILWQFCRLGTPITIAP